MIKGQVIGGDFDQVLIREKAESPLELGELLIAEEGNTHMLLQVYDLMYSSQVSRQSLEFISGMHLEENVELKLFDRNLRYYNIAKCKVLLTLNTKEISISKRLPPIFSAIRTINESDLYFLSAPKYPVFVGYLRSGSKKLSQKIFLNSEETLAHHVLIPATTGRGKSNLTKCMLYNLLTESSCGVLVIDPHDEYFGRNKPGLKDHPGNKVVYYTPQNPPAGTRSLKISIILLKPFHFESVLPWSDPQKEALYAFWKAFKDQWIHAILSSTPLEGFSESTLAVLRRRCMGLLDIVPDGEILRCKGIFDTSQGATTVDDIMSALEKPSVVIIDTSSFSGASELLVSNLLATEIFDRYRKYKRLAILESKPVISIVLEEAPRVLGKQVLESGPNAFSRIAKEGRKFKIGLFAITQLPSLIPKEILANMNTKIILGLEMGQERQAIIDSASQDLSHDQRTIASLDRGEAIISSNFVKFPIPLAIPRFEDLINVSAKVGEKKTRAGPSYPEMKDISSHSL